MKQPKNNVPAISDPAYLWGHLLATRALVLGLAKLTTTQEDLSTHGLAAIELLRTAAHAEAIPETFFAALNDFEAWLEASTSD